MGTKNNNIKEYIDKSNLTAKELADKVGCSDTDISNYIANRRKPNHRRLLLLGKYLKARVDQLYPGAKRKFYFEL